MTKTNGGSVRSGYYVSSNWEIIPVEKDGDPIPSGSYVRVPTWAALALMPILGGLFVVFMPFIGLYLFFKHVAGKVAGYISELSHAALAPTAAVGTAHFTGSKGEEAPASESKLEKLESEIEELRKP